MSSATVRQMAERIAALTETRMGLRRTGTPAEQLRRAARALPPAKRGDLEALAKAHEMAADPAGYLRIDQAAIAEAYDRALKQVNAMTPGWQRRLYFQAVSSNLWVNLSLFAVLLAAGVYYVLFRG